MRKLIVILIAVLFVLFLVNGLTIFAQGKTGEFSGKIFTKAPENPEGPGEVIAAFFFLLKEGKYSETEKLVSTNALGEFQNSKSKVKIKDVMQVVKSIEIRDKDMLTYSYWCVSVRFIENGITGNYVVDKEMLDKIRKGGPVNLGGQKNQRVKLLSINEEHIAGREVYVYYIIHIVDDPECADFGGEDEFLGYKERAIPAELVKQNGKWKMLRVSGRIFIKAPEKLDTPEKVIVAFFFLVKEGKYAEAMELMVHNPFEEHGIDESMIVIDKADNNMQGLQKIGVNRRDVLEKSYWEVTLYFIEDDSKRYYQLDEETFNIARNSKGKPVNITRNGKTETVKLISVDEEHLANTEAVVYLTLFYTTTNSWEDNRRIELVKLDGKWRIVELW